MPNFRLIFVITFYSSTLKTYYSQKSCKFYLKTFNNFIIYFCHRIYNSMYVPVAVLSCEESSTVTGLANSPLTMTAHTVTVPSPSLTV